MNLLSDIKFGIGTWAWGDKLVWGYGNGYASNEIGQAFKECVAGGVKFFDTAEVYGQGKSESMLGDLLEQENGDFLIASKMMPFPWRVWKGSLRYALQNSLRRLKLTKLPLYQMHWPLPPVKVDTWMNRMADLMDAGLIGAIGVSNYSLEQTQLANETLKLRGYSLTSNQVEYHLLDRKIEKNGLREYCDAEEIRIIAYSPMAMGILTGKYTPENPPKGTRLAHYNQDLLKKIQPLLKGLIRIGNDNEGKTAGQVALNWCIQKGTIPIPGVKNANQAAQNLGALGWELQPDEIALLDEISSEVMQT